MKNWIWITLILLMTGILILFVTKSCTERKLIKQAQEQQTQLSKKLDATDSLIRIYNKDIDSMSIILAKTQDSLKVLKQKYVIINSKWYEKIKSARVVSLDTILWEISNYLPKK